MVEKGFMSEVRNYSNLTLGETEKLFITLFSIPNYSYSAYEIFSYLKKSKPMAYKNVHKRVKRLHDLGLIKEVAKKSQRNAIKYELTTFGLVQRLLIPDVELTFLERNKDNIILNNILFRFFEEVTIHEIGSAIYWLRIYLRDCCRAIITLAEAQRPDLEEIDKKYQEWYENWYPNKLEPDWGYHRYASRMEGVITAQIKNFIVQIIEFAKFEYLDGRYNPVLKHEPREQLNPFPSELLRTDTKFIPILKEMKKDFDYGYKILLPTKNAK